MPFAAASLEKPRMLQVQQPACPHTDQPANGYTMHTVSYFTQASYKDYQTLKYWAICTPLEKICPKELPSSSDWDDDEEEERKDQYKGEDQDKDSEKKTSQTNPIFFTATP